MKVCSVCNKELLKGEKYHMLERPVDAGTTFQIFVLPILISKDCKIKYKQDNIKVSFIKKWQVKNKR